MVPEKRARIKRTFYEPAPLPVYFEKNVKYSELKAVDRQLRKQWTSNLRRYHATGINDKIAFAKAGYRFLDQPECPAILTGISSIRMRADSNRGVIAHKCFLSLPVGFIILFSKHRITSVQHRGDLKACYQVSLYSGKFFLTHTVEIVNHPVRHDPDSDIDPLLYRTKQNMAIANCSLKRSKHPISAKNIMDFPAYRKITKAVPKGHEVHYNYGTGHRLTPPVPWCTLFCVFSCMCFKFKRVFFRLSLIALACIYRTTRMLTICDNRGRQAKMMQNYGAYPRYNKID